LAIEGVSVTLPTARGALGAVDNVSLELAAGRTLGIVGESGSGKTMLSRAVAQLLPRRAKLSGVVRFAGETLTSLAPEALRRLRGRSLAFVFQDPMTSLNPVLSIGSQIIETLREHLGLDRAAAVQRAVELLGEVGIPSPAQRLAQYPHQFSGGMRQRVAIAIALSCEPARDGDDPDHPRLGRGRRSHRRGRRHVCGPGGGAGADGASLQGHAHALYGGPDRGDPQAGGAAAHAAEGDFGTAARSDAAEPRLRLCAALRLRQRALPPARAGARGA
jgi:predicted ABC-type transport system involved in lysophospholipase L1 biosynthesis ATPase subunit